MYWLGRECEDAGERHAHGGPCAPRGRSGLQRRRERRRRGGHRRREHRHQHYAEVRTENQEARTKLMANAKKMRDARREMRDM